MNDHGEPVSRSEFELSFKDTSLHVPGRMVVVVVESGFADGDHRRAPQSLLDLGGDFSVPRGCFVRVHTGSRRHTECERELDGLLGGG